jgi:adenylate kinase family enzyme
MDKRNQFDVGKRINVVGTTGMGKTTLASQLGKLLGLEHVELDNLFWEENWAQPNDEVFLPRVEKALRGDRWVIDGNYTRAREIVWKDVQTVILLDYPIRVAIWRIIIRSIRRIVSKEKIWGKNYESFRGAFFSKDSLIKWLLATYKERRKKYYEIFNADENKRINFIILKSPRETNNWLERLSE